MKVPTQFANRWSHWRWVVFVAVAAIAISKLLRSETDFGIVLAAAREMQEGGFDLYRKRETSGAYPYPHWVLLPLVPALGLPETLLRVLYGLSLGWATLWIIGDLRRAVGRYVALRPWHWLLFGLLFMRWFSANYTNGQLSLWVAALTIRGLRLLDDRAAADGSAPRHPQSVGAGVALGAAAAAKLTPLAFLAALPFMGAWRTALVMLASIVVFVFVLPLAYLSGAEHVGHLRDLYEAMIRPLFDGGAGGDAAIWTGPNASIEGTLRTVLRDARLDPAAEPRSHWVDLSPNGLQRAETVWSGAMLVLCAVAFFRARAQRERVLVQGAVVCIATALFSPLTRTYHCSILLLAGLLFVVDRPKSLPRRVAWGSVALAFALSMTLRQRSLLGRELWFVLDRIGLLHLAIVGMLALLASRRRFEPAAQAGAVANAV